MFFSVGVAVGADDVAYGGAGWLGNRVAGLAHGGGLSNVFEEIQGRGVAGQVAASQVRIDHGPTELFTARQALDAEFAHDKSLLSRVDLSPEVGAIPGKTTPECVWETEGREDWTTETRQSNEKGFSEKRRGYRQLPRSGLVQRQGQRPECRLPRNLKFRTKSRAALGSAGPPCSLYFISFANFSASRYTC